ncbi:hypothetical protein N480_12585 [Pseudoalteromonas luteoviolacea S2607]|uniref:DUF2975 domain-containing protein n=1 Tax=Pseudoalteromonas luteoviolacea TaxID=43657 RepID=UPI0007B0B265|nr:DUF2975 domain-containing protein [Pseudoalteromonas luteoviolacea]KZN38483.1 hypothetical protein N480_12585 [Pseudoalteromonas luteoviolacea S2607]
MSPYAYKVQKLSKTVRWSMLGVSAIVLLFMGYQLILNGQVRYIDSSPFIALWESNDVSRTILFLLSAPTLFLVFFSIYWMNKLLLEFQRGDFFSHTSFRCYIGFVWTKITSILYGTLLNFAMGMWHSKFYASTDIVVKVEFGYLTTLILLAIIAHLLKAAKELEDENKEFI